MEGPVYIAGPMTGYRNFNFESFREAERVLKDKFPGIIVENPIQNGGDTPGSMPYGYYFRKGIEQLLACKSIVMLPDYKKSRGANCELKVAFLLGLDCYLYDYPEITPLTPGVVA